MNHGFSYFLSFHNDSWFLHDISKFINCFSWKIKIISVFPLRVFKKKHVTSAKENLHMHLSMNMKSKKDFLSLFSIDFSQSVSWSWHFMSQMFFAFCQDSRISCIVLIPKHLWVTYFLCNVFRLMIDMILMKLFR